jgi:hypothetical protein
MAHDALIAGTGREFRHRPTALSLAAKLRGAPSSPVAKPRILKFCFEIFRNRLFPTNRGDLANGGGSILRHKLSPRAPPRRGRTSANADVVVRLTDAARVLFCPAYLWPQAHTSRACPPAILTSLTPSHPPAGKMVSRLLRGNLPWLLSLLSLGYCEGHTGGGNMDVRAYRNPLPSASAGLARPQS